MAFRAKAKARRASGRVQRKLDEWRGPPLPERCCCVLQRFVMPLNGRNALVRGRLVYRRLGS